jgi:predicted nucleotidyltransferase
MGHLDERIRSVLQSHKDELRNRYHVESLFVFGSVSRGDEQPKSDIDILVNYQEKPGIFDFLRLKNYLETITGRSVDLVTESALKKPLNNEILQEAIRVA